MWEIAHPDLILADTLLHFVRWHPGVESSKAEISRNAVCSRLRNHRGSKRPLKALDKDPTDYIFRNGIDRFVSVVFLTLHPFPGFLHRGNGIDSL